jgi:4-hydroxy-2-oxoheptanedioate aldolase
MIETALRKGVMPRAEIHDPSEAAPDMALGVQHFCLGTNVRTLYGWYTEKGGQMRELLSPTS